ncbi:hypothetical protein [Nostoc sp. TCL26-01]|uniref:hypothetical protein n=1 Tax=Nostoc sp. TCL26-01 TaxID=2576904 RepID=UPI0015B8F1C5|nr:hypothetical protein [Nostoc sp. TCL26-01]QLE56296.1 hypothetical protein FD725_12530 [Nostoc sp. TCL26-01]
MFFGHIEQELLWEAVDANWQNKKLPDNVQLPIESELGKQDIWEYQSQDMQPEQSQQPKQKA